MSDVFWKKENRIFYEKGLFVSFSERIPSLGKDMELRNKRGGGGTWGEKWNKAACTLGKIYVYFGTLELWILKYCEYKKYIKDVVVQSPHVETGQERMNLKFHSANHRMGYLQKNRFFPSLPRRQDTCVLLSRMEEEDFELGSREKKVKFVITHPTLSDSHIRPFDGKNDVRLWEKREGGYICDSGIIRVLLAFIRP